MNVRALVRRAPTTLRNAVGDLRYGGLLGGTIKTRYGNVGAHDVGNADYRDLPPLFAGAAVTPDDILVDVGCGKGRVINWFLATYPQNRVVGIELDPDICAKTAHRLRRHENVSIVCGDAITHLPADGTVFFLFNPFDESVLRRFVAAFRELEPTSRPRRIVYHNCKSIGLFAEDPRFEVTPIDLPSGSFRSALVTERST